ncbi:NUDIX hydrolase [Falsochrobactrum shanghaiense]|uniref:NUDIX hydrolase n=2 Tax=Falsochrobactrum shanghaiense TaxID=2201899 RepID=A0A316JBT2_9HYPH|nr:NUDIX hydrolase [Falsochrobactrum shanghaiense]
MGNRKWKKRIRRAKAGQEIEQGAALPYRFENGSLKIMLVTSRRTRRFTLPKGWPMKKRSLADTARIEAQEEAGIEGKVARSTIGHYLYWKRLKRVFIPVKVSVYPLYVQRENARWPEYKQRQRKWLSPDEAGLLVDEPQLISLIASLNPNESK